MKILYFLPILLVVFLLFSQLLIADTTVVLRPTADGGNDSLDWKNTAGAQCNSANCYLEVNESSGSFCSNSDGDISYIEGSIENSTQTFDLDESSIPNNSIITQIDITACHKKGENPQPNSFQTRKCIDGTCSNSGTSITTGGAYQENTQSHTGLNITKTAASDIEVGVAITGTTSRKLRVSQISAVVTYTPPDTTAPAAVTNLALSNPSNSSMLVSWTSPGDDGGSGTATSYDLRYSTSSITDGNFSSATQVTGEPTPLVAGTSQSMTVSGLSASTTYFFALKTLDEVPNTSAISNVPSLATTAESPSPSPSPSSPPSGGGGGSGGELPKIVTFSGQTYPGSKIEILRKSLQDELYTQVPIESIEINKDGSFFISYTGLIKGDYLFALRAKDKDGRSTGILAFDVSLFGAFFKVNNILVPPTIGLEKSLIPKNEILKTMGYAIPGNMVELEVDGLKYKETKADAVGFWSFDIDTTPLNYGEHNMRARQIAIDGKANNFSLTRVFKISKSTISKADINNDGVVNIRDWSIFLFRWGSQNESLRIKNDLTNDGKIDIFDLSVFLHAIKL